jgi:hypothetical protein
MRHISRALNELVDEVNRRGITVRGRQLTPTQVSDLQDRWVISTEEWSHPGRPRGGSWTRYPPSAIATIEAVAKGLNEKRDTNRAILVAFADGAKVVDTGVRVAYTAYLRELRKTVQLISAGEKRLRLPTGVLHAPLDSLSKRALVGLANGTKPVPEALDALISILGLPDDLRTAPREASAIDYPTFEELLGSLGIGRLLQKVFRADPADLVWAAQSMLNLFRYSLVLYRITSSTDSSGLPVVSDDPEIAASAEHVFRTLVAGGRFLDRLMALSNKRTDIEMAAFNAPVLLVAFDMLPAEARGTYEARMEQVTENLPRLVAIESLIKDIPVELRHLLSWESQARLASLPADEIEELRGIARAWGEQNPDMVALLTGEPSPVQLPPSAGPHRSSGVATRITQPAKVGADRHIHPQDCVSWL